LHFKGLNQSFNGRTHMNGFERPKHRQATNQFWQTLAVSLTLVAVSGPLYATEVVRCESYLAGDVSTAKNRPNRKKVDTTKLDPVIENILTSLKKSVIGQPRAAEAYARILGRAKKGIQRRGTAGAILVYGPTGVGKTKAVEDLARAIGGNLLGLEGGNFMTAGSVSSLTGAAPMYAGHGTTEPMITQAKIDAARGTVIPVTIILINELDKAHPDFLDWWLKVLDDGTNTVWSPKAEGEKADGAGTENIDFRKVIVIATTNGGAEVVRNESARLVQSIQQQRPGLLYQAEGVSDLVDQVPENPEFKDAVSSSLLHTFKRPEFIGRWDELVPAYPLLQKGYLKIVQIELSRLMRQYALASSGLGLKIRLSPRATELLLKQMNPALGARNLSKVVDKFIDGPITAALGSGEIVYGNAVAVDVNEAHDGFDFYTRERKVSILQKQTEAYEAARPKSIDSKPLRDSKLDAPIEALGHIADTQQRLSALKDFVDDQAKLSEDEALKIMQTIPHGVNWGYEKPADYFPIAIMNEKNVRQWGTPRFAQMDLEIVMKILSKVSGPRHPDLANELSKATLAVMGQSLAIKNVPNEFVHDVYYTIGVLIGSGQHGTP
jgi:ATP-dependent protease Clp ATPase subunit